MQFRHFVIFNIFVYYFCVSEFSNVGISKINSKEQKTNDDVLLTLMSTTKNKKPYFLLPRVCFFFSRQNKSKLSVSLYATTQLIIVVNLTLKFTQPIASQAKTHHFHLFVI